MPLAKELFFNDGSLNVLGQAFLITSITIMLLIPIIVGFKRGYVSDAVIGVLFTVVFTLIVFNALEILLALIFIAAVGIISYLIGKSAKWLNDRFRQ
jgi:hypothetical protein